ncbi:glutathione hydrolase 1 proenzyme isoform X2 [Drosophila elegans]|uniref:glutathione hydrolase 1 proenzyme isoform X2 n=1 Tax=Drosophila elegans TaxID=30023 RepID=UPI0007E6D7C1|nr:glutathione hydrolase 1 proenzyme isoform X2 [Drosophila elegans]
MHSTACGVGASATNLSTLQTSSITIPPASAGQGTGTGTGSGAGAAADAHKMVHHSNEDAMNKIPLKSAGGLDSDEEKNGGELMQDTAAAEEARREQMRVKVLAWMKKLTIVLICFIGIALISYVIISLCFSDWPKSTPNRNITTTTTTATTTTSTSTEATTTAAKATATEIAIATAAATEIASSLAPLSPATAATIAPSATATTISTTTSTTTTTTTTRTTATSTPQPPPTTTTTTSRTDSNPSPTLKTFHLTDEQQQQEVETESIGNLNQGSSSNTASTPAEDALPNVVASTAATTAGPPAWLANQIKIDTSEQFESVLGVYQHGAVSSDNLECSKIGSGILQKNGSAVDAAIAALLCNGLLTLQSLGIGGGHLMNVYNRKERHATTIDAREVAPYASEGDMFAQEPEKSYKGPLSIGVPGEAMGYHVAHQRFGKLPWADLVAPSLELCEKGYHVSQHMERSLAAALPYIKEHEQYQIYLNAKTGKPHVAGTVVKPPKNLCNTYKLLAENGPMDLYNGTAAKLLAKDLEDMGSIISSDDLEFYEADVIDSITMDLGEDTLYVAPPVSSGSLVAHVLSILQGYNFSNQDLATEELRARTIHRFAEAMKFAFAKRSELGDMHFVDARELVSKLNSREFGEENRAKINDSHVLPNHQSYGAEFGSIEDPDGTSHLCVLAPNGDAVSVTSSINSYFGSGLIGTRTGIVLNNGMNDFAVANNFFGLPPSPANVIEGHKRAMSSQSPVLLADSLGNIRMVIGAAGGSKIIPAVVEVAANVLWFDQDLRKAVTAPRFYHQLLPDVLEYEEGGFSESLLQLLAQRGHTLKAISRLAGSVVTAISRNATAIYANADYRKRGGVAGF